MKRYTRITAFFMLLVFVLTPITHASNTTYVYVSDNMEVEIIHPGLSEEKLIYIAKTLTSETTTSETTTYGLVCTLFGHKLVGTINTVTVHMTYDTYPYCECKTYESNVCERCDYMETELVSTSAVGCCVK